MTFQQRALSLVLSQNIKRSPNELIWMFKQLTGYNQECEKSTPVNYFWYRSTLNITPDIEVGGSLQWWLVVCLATAWCVVYICFIRGIDSIGKVS